jgi:hypothetical protein
LSAALVVVAVAVVAVVVVVSAFRPLSSKKTPLQGNKEIT